MGTANPMHVDSKSIADEINKAVDDSGTTRTAAKVTHAVSTGVTTPANIAYTQADQTALANAAISAVAKVNAVIDALIAAGLMSST